MQATKKLMNSDNYYLNTQLMKFIVRCLSLRNNLLSNESNVTHTQFLFLFLLHDYYCYKFPFSLVVRFCNTVFTYSHGNKACYCCIVDQGGEGGSLIMSYILLARQIDGTHRD